MADGAGTNTGAPGGPPVDLDRFFEPRVILVVGASATPGSQSAGLWQKIRAWGRAHDAAVIAVNPTRDEIDGERCYRTVADIDVDVPIDLAVILVADVLGVLDDVLAAEPRFAMVFGAGFAETGAAGEAAQRDLEARVAASRTRLLGPNTNLNAFEPFRDDLDGPAIALITQSGHQGRPVVQAQELGVRFSHWAPTGNEADLEFADFARYFVDRPEVGAIACYIEGFKDGRSLVLAADHAARGGVPIVCVKVGRSDAGRSMARSHTGHLAGSDEVVSGVFEQYGVVRVDGLDELTDVAAMFARTGPPRAVTRGERPLAGDLGVAVYAISGGTGAHMVDLCASAGLHVPELAEATQAALRGWIPSFLRVSNPVDSGGPPSMDERGRLILDAILADDAVDVLICPITGAIDAISRPLATDLVAAAAATDKAVFVVWGSPDVADPVYRDILVPAAIPTFRTFANCVTAARAYVDHWSFQARYSSPFTTVGVGADADAEAEPDADGEACADADGEAGADDRQRRGGESTGTDPGSLGTAADERRELARVLCPDTGPLGEHRSKELVTAYGIAVTRDILCHTVDEAGAAAAALGGGPVVVKISSSSFPHKSEHGLVLTGVAPGDAGRAFATVIDRARAVDPEADIDGVLVCEQIVGGVEAVVGFATDDLFGPTVMVGLGGTFVEIYRDVAFRVPPFDRDEARRMVLGLRAAPLFGGFRGAPAVDVEALIDVVLAVQQMAIELGATVREVDLNPVVVRPDGAVALDALIVAS